jgi:hypothetical protein
LSGGGSESAQNRTPCATHAMAMTAPTTAKTASGAPRKQLGVEKKPRGGAAGKKPRGRGGPSKVEKLAKAAIKEAASKFDGPFTPEQMKELGLSYFTAMCTNLFPGVVDDMVAARAAAPPAPAGFNPAEEAEPEAEAEAEAEVEAEAEAEAEAEVEAEVEAEPEAEVAEPEPTEGGDETVSDLDSD